MSKANEDLRIEILKSGMTYRQVAEEMKISPVWLSRVMAKKLTPEMRQRINIAIDELTKAKHWRV